MKKFSQLFSQAWNAVFRNQKTFWILFLLMNGSGIILMLFFYGLGYDISEWLNSQKISQEDGLPFILYIISTVLFGGFFGFMGILYLAHIFSEKKVKFGLILSQWKKIFPYIGTIISVILCYVIIWLSVAIVFIIIFGIGYYGYNSVSGASREFALILYVVGGIVISVIVLTTIFIALWLSVSLNTFATPGFFLDNQRYFQAPLTSKRMIAGRWWRTVGFLIMISVVTMLVPVILTGVETYVYGPSIVSSLVLAIINGIAGMVLISFLFALYIDYRENPLKNKKVPIKKINNTK